MEEDIAIIDKNTRNEKIKNFFINNKKQLIISTSVIIFIIFGYFAYGDFQDSKRNKIAERYNSATINFITGDKTNV